MAPAFALPAAVALFVLYVGLDELGLLFWQVERFAQSALYPLYVMIGITRSPAPCCSRSARAGACSI